MPILMGMVIQILYLGVVHKLHTLVIQNMLTMGESRDMSRIYIALQGLLLKCVWEWDGNTHMHMSD